MTQKEIQMWQARITRAEAYMNERRSERLQAIRLYTGTFFGSALNNNDDITEVNFVYEFCDVLVSAIYARNPHIFVRATSAQRVAFAETIEKVINYYVNELNWKKKMQSCLLDAILQPPGWIGLGYLYINEKTRMKKELEDEFPELKSLNEKKEKVESEIGIFDETVKMDDVFTEHISSWNVLFPEGYHNIRECPYLIVTQKTTLEDLHSNPIYKDVKYQIKNNRSTVNNQRPRKLTMQADVPLTGIGDEMDKELIPVQLCHVWDRRSMTRFTLVRNFIDDSLFEREWDYLSEGFPFFPLIFNEIPATDEKCNAYPLSDIVPMFPQLKELSLINSAMMRHRKRTGTVILAQEGAIPETKATQIQNASDLDLIVLPNVSEAALRVFNPPPLPNDFYSMRNMILEDLLRISGFQQLLHSQQNSVETATESENVRMGAVLRQSRRVDVVEEHSKEMAMYFAGLLWQFKSKKQIEEIIGEQVTDEMWPELPNDKAEARRILQKQLNFRIDAGSTKPPKDETIERSQWERLAGVVKASFPNRIKDDEFLKQWLKKYDAHDIEKIVISSDEPEIAAAQEENKLLMQGMIQVVSPNTNHMLHLQVHSQVYQTPGMQSTPAMDKHVSDHAKFMEMNSPKVNPQKGDTKISPQSTNQNIQRGGNTEFADVLGASKPREYAQNTGGK